ncbi:MAG: chemotaxis protein CheW [Acetobacteraceae bacterium]|nr:chemotaxis protein CheW [Acetobacteraceae bacterium]MDI3307286.1 chemotaxis protein CheW [Acetobacteraceae bacterium]
MSSDVQSIKQIALRVQPYLDTVRSGAVETLQRHPDRSRIAAAQRALATVRETAAAAGVEALVAAATIVGEALEIAGAEGADPALHLGHYASAAAADLTRTVHALLLGEDPTPSLEHARAMLRAMPRGGTQQFVEVDLSDREQLARVLAAAQHPPRAGAAPGRPPLRLADLEELTAHLDAYATHVRAVTAPAERHQALDGLLDVVTSLERRATDLGLGQIARVMGAVRRVVEAHRGAELPLSPDAVELIIAGRQIVPMILDALDDPDRVARPVDALVEQGAQLLIQVRRASAPPEDFWLIPDEADLTDPGRDIDHAAPVPPPLLERADLPEPGDGGPSTDATALFAQDAAALLPRLAEAVLALERDPGSPVASRRLQRTLLALRGAAAAAGLHHISAQAARMVALLTGGDQDHYTALLREAHALSDALEQVIPDAAASEPVLLPAQRARPLPAEVVERLVAQAGELAVRAGGHEHRSHRLGLALQELRDGRDRVRDLARMLAERPADAADLALELVQVVTRLGRIAGELDQLRAEWDASRRRQLHALAQLDEGLRALRLVPFSTLVPRLERAALGTARAAGTLVRFVADGGATEIDAALLDGLLAALLPLVRNAAQHGVEPPDVRRAAGKPEEGTVRVRAERDGSQIVVQVSDDGAGIDDREIARQAARSGFPVPPDGLTRERALQLLFLPGFGSTPAADGRPPRRAGIDTAGLAVAAIRGTITVESEVGIGTTFTVRVPVLQPLTEATVVVVAGDRYVLPFSDLDVCQPAPQVEAALDGSGYVASWQGEILPVADLGALLGLRPAEQAAQPGQFLLVRHPDERWLVRVDAVLGRQSVMLRPPGPREQLPATPGHVGATALPSGEIAHVVDLTQLLDAARQARTRPPAPLLRRPHAPRALVADAAIGERRSVSQALARDGWCVLEARDGLDVREVLEATPPDLCVLDVDLPLLHAFRVVEAIRARAGLPVIALLALDDGEGAARAAALGARARLRKPCDTDALLRAVREVVGAA